MAKSNDKTHQKRMDKNCHIPDLVQAFSNVENGGKVIIGRITKTDDSGHVVLKVPFNTVLTKNSKNEKNG